MALTLSIQRRLFATLRKVGIKDSDERHALIGTYTEGRTESTRDLTDNEALDLIRDLGQSPQAAKSDRMRKKVIALFRSMGVEANGKADMVKIDDWCIQYGYLHKGLNKYATKELPKLISQVEKIYEKWLQKAR